MSKAKQGIGPWECPACTWVNENEQGLACIMCQTERRVASTKNLNSHGAAFTESSAASFTSCGNLINLPRKTTSATLARCSAGYDPFQSKQCDGAEESSAERQGEEFVAKSPESEIFESLTGDEVARSRSNTTEGENGKWDAFASLERSYQSSDDDGSDDDDNNHNHSNGGRKRCSSEIGSSTDEIGKATRCGQWDAFKSLEQNYESSEEEYDNSSDEHFEERYDGMDDNGIVDEDDHPFLNKKNGEKSDPGMGFVDLVDSNEDNSVCDLDVRTTGKETNESDKQSKSRKPLEKSEPYIINDDSESSLSEIESRRPLASPSARALPPWQRRRSTPIRMADNLKPSNSFSCMSGRNDLVGGSGAGVNGFRLSNRKGDVLEGRITAKRKARKSSTSSSAASSGTSTRKTSKSTSTVATASTTRKRTRRNSTSKAASKAPAKKRRKRSYRKSNRRSSSRGRSNNSTSGRGAYSNNSNGWSARERGIRQPYRRGGGESAPYMAITKQEPMLRNVGGASIQF